jgi:hypothetical protein
VAEEVPEHESHAELMAKAAEAAAGRQVVVEQALRDAFSHFIEERSVEVVKFSEMNAEELAGCLIAYPLILKPLIASCNVAARAIERDIGIKNLNTYLPILTKRQAVLVAEYIMPFLPPDLEIVAMSHLDRVEFIDKEIRMGKGRWEQLVTNALTKYSREPFRKRKFIANDKPYELDAASPPTGAITVGVDVKRIEARRDIHKRIDEIAQKAVKFKQIYPEGKFGAIIYYPFIAEYENIKSRLDTPEVDAVLFAGKLQAAIENAAISLLTQFGVATRDDMLQSSTLIERGM